MDGDTFTVTYAHLRPISWWYIVGVVGLLAVAIAGVLVAWRSRR